MGGISIGGGAGSCCPGYAYGINDNIGVRYASISVETYMDQILRLKVGVHWLITNSTTYSQEISRVMV